MLGIEDEGLYPPSTIEPSRVVTTPDGVAIAVYELGGTGPALLLVHATGFCGPVLAPLARELTGRFRCVAFDLRAHGRSGVPEDGQLGWEGFATDVLAVVDACELDHPVGFGHSCGGAALVLAEERHPATFGGLYLFEPIILPVDHPSPEARSNPLSEGARRRRSHFASRHEALANYSSKPPFDALRPDVLAAYVDNGFAPDPDGGIDLRCARENEADIFALSLSHEAYATLDRISCPVTLACGEHTDAIGPDSLALFAHRLPRSTTVVMDGLNHFGPLQDPHRVAGSVDDALQAI